MKKYTFILLSILFISFSTVSAQTLELTEGSLKLLVYPDTGKFSLLHLSEVGKNRYEALFDDRNNSATSWFSVLSNTSVFSLSKRIGRPVKTEQTQQGVRVVFNPTDDFEVIQNFSFVKDIKSGVVSSIKIETTLENTSGKRRDFAIKALFDTNLGENEGIHFYTDRRLRISSETDFLTERDKDSRLTSANKEYSLSFPLTPPLVTKPERIIIANWERLNTLTWKPDFLEGRSFNTIYTVNDSAVLYVWPMQTLEPNQKMTIVLHIGSILPVEANDVTVVQQKELEKNSTQVPSQSVSEQNHSLEFVLSEIQRILTRIEEIEKNPSQVSDSELAELNAQLDELIKKSGLRQ